MQAKFAGLPFYIAGLPSNIIESGLIIATQFAVINQQKKHLEGSQN